MHCVWWRGVHGRCGDVHAVPCLGLVVWEVRGRSFASGCMGVPLRNLQLRMDLQVALSGPPQRTIGSTGETGCRLGWYCQRCWLSLCPASLPLVLFAWETLPLSSACCHDHISEGAHGEAGEQGEKGGRDGCFAPSPLPRLLKNRIGARRTLINWRNRRQHHTVTCITFTFVQRTSR